MRSSTESEIVAQAERWSHLFSKDVVVSQPVRRKKSNHQSFATAELADALSGSKQMSLWAPLARGVEVRRTKPAVWDLSTGIERSYEEIERRALRVARWLQGARCVGVLAPNSAIVLEAHFAIARIGAVVLNCNTRLTAPELAYTMDNAECYAAICDVAFAGRLGERVSTVMWVNNGQESEEFLHSGDRRQVDYEILASSIDVAGDVDDSSGEGKEMYYTSGTTGRPKGVVLTARIVTLHALGCIVEHRLEPEDVWLHAAPMFHLVDAYAIFAITWIGAAHATMPAYSTESFLRVARDRQMTVTNVASTMITMLVASNKHSTLPNSLTLLSCGGAPLPRSTAKNLLSVFKNEFFQSYGMTECCGKIATSIIDDDDDELVLDEPGKRFELTCTSGRPFRLIDVRIVNHETKQDVKLGEIGEVWISGPTVFEKYWGLPREDFFEEQRGTWWFRTGDLASMNDDGYITVTDRLKDMILVGSENVYCVEVERVLHEHDAVAMACVYGLPDVVLGERVKAVVQLVGNGNVDVRTLQRFAASRLADYKVPAVIEFVDELPITGSGKVNKLELKRRDEVNLAPSREHLFAVEWEPVGIPSTKRRRGDIIVIAAAADDAQAIADELDEFPLIVLSGEGGIGESELEKDVATLDGAQAQHVVFVSTGGNARLALRHSLAVARRVAPQAQTLAVITRGCVGGKRDPAAGAVWGFWRAAATELPNCVVRLIDVDEKTSATQTIQTAMHDDSFESEERAWVDGRLLQPLLKPIVSRWRPRGSFQGSTHVITGAFGGLGTELATRLARAGAHKLVLVSRRAPPPIKELSSSIEVECVACDVSVETDVRALFENLNSTPDAIWHLAGVVDDGALSTVSVERFEKVLAPKIDGTELLVRYAPATAKVVSFSSVYGLLGSPQLTHYAAANAFQDAFAITSESRPYLAVSWGVWADAGMAHRFGPAFQSSIKSAGLAFIDLNAGFEMLFEAYFQHDVRHCAYVPCPDWKNYVDTRRRRGLKAQPLCSALAREGRNIRVEDEDTAVDASQQIPPAAPEEIVLRVRRALSEVVGDAVDVDAASPDAPLAALGVSSLHAVSLATTLSTDTELDLPPTLVFECVSIQGVADYVAEKLAPQSSSRTESASTPPISTVSAPERVVRSKERKRVVGAACRLPGGVDDVSSSLWSRLRNGANCVVLRAPAHRPPKAARPAGYLDAEQVTCFDRDAFAMSKAEACVLDPQQRLALVCGAEALQFVRGDAHDTATFVGVTQVDYAHVLHLSSGRKSAYSATGTATIAAVANRIAYVFDLKGPSVAVDTACSSTLVALNLAHQSPEKSALVGGVNVILTDRWSEAFALAGMLSPTHRCAYGDDSADGYVRGEASSFIALEELNGESAPLDLLGVAVNQDGKSNGLTAPNPAAQAAMLEKALDNAGCCRPGYVEAHGTGTRLGDPIELQALSRVYGDLESPLETASIKSNFGHSECAAAGSSLTKLFVLALNAPQLAMSLHVRKLNTVVDWANLGVRVVTEHQVRITRGNSTTNGGEGNARRRLACSGFGFAGTNAHAIFSVGHQRVGSADSRSHETRASRPSVHILESHSPRALAATAKRWIRRSTKRNFCVASVSAANASRRRLFRPHCPQIVRAAFWDFESLEAIAIGQSHVANDNTFVPAKEALCFVFTGQGSAYVGMGSDAVRNDENLDGILRELARIGDATIGGGDSAIVSDALFGRSHPGSPAASSSTLQAAQVCLQYAIYQHTMDRGVPESRRRPVTMIGHSLGEISALACAGMITFESALKFAAGRGAAVDAMLSRSPTRGGMMAVACSRDQAKELLNGTSVRCSIAVVNSPKAVVIAGIDEASLNKAEMLFQGFAVKRLDVSAAFHSPAISPALSGIKASASHLRASETSSSGDVVVISTLSAASLTSEDVVDNPGRWSSHAREICDFDSAVREALKECDVFIEIGSPRTQLGRHVEAIADDEGVSIAFIGTAATTKGRRAAVDTRSTRAALETLYYKEGDIAVHDSLGPEIPPHAVATDQFAWIEHSDFTPIVDAEDARCEQRLVYAHDWEVVTPDSSSHHIRTKRALVVADSSDGVALQAAQAVFGRVESGDDASSGDFDCVVFGLGLRESDDPDDIEGGVSKLMDVLSQFGEGQSLIVILTRHAYASAGVHSNLSGAALWGACESARLEIRRGARIVCVDVDVPGPLMLEAPFSHPHESGLYVDVRRSVVKAKRIVSYGEHVHGASHLWAASPARGTVIVTGGTGALGMTIARWLQSQSNGSLRIVLLSRSGEFKGEDDELSHARMEVVKCDVSDERSLRSACLEYRGTIVGAIHAAGVLCDATVKNVSPDQISQVMRPKVRGALNLTRLLQGEPLEFCWLFSSVTALMGNAGQSVYGAANAVLDSIARLGGPAVLSVQWGPWAERGMAAPMREKLQGTSAWVPLADKDALAGFGALLSSKEHRPRVASVARFHGPNLRDSLSKFHHRHTLFRHVVSMQKRAPASDSVLRESQRGQKTNGVSDRQSNHTVDVVTAAIRDALGSFLSPAASKDALDMSASLSSLGLDSLDGAEIAATLSSRLNFAAAPTFLLEVETVGDLRDLVKRELERVGPSRVALDNGSLTLPSSRISSPDFSHEVTIRQVLEAHGAVTTSLTRDSELGTLGLDSLDSASVATDLAASFDVVLSPMLLLELSTFGDLCDLCGEGGSPSASQVSNNHEVVRESVAAIDDTPPVAEVGDKFVVEALTTIEALRLPTPATLMAFGILKLIWWSLRIALVTATTSCVFVMSEEDVLNEKGSSPVVLVAKMWAMGMAMVFVAIGTSLAFGVFSKWILIGRYREIQNESLWSWYGVRCELVNRAVGPAEASIAWSLPDGSPWWNVWYSLLGVKMGRNVSLVAGACRVAPDLCAIGDEVVFERGAAMVPTRLDARAKRFGARKCIVGQHVRVSTDSVIAGGCVVGAGSVVKPSSVAQGIVAPRGGVVGSRVLGEETAESTREDNCVHVAYITRSKLKLKRDASISDDNKNLWLTGRQRIALLGLQDFMDFVALAGLGFVPALVAATLVMVRVRSPTLSYLAFASYMCLFALATKRALLKSPERDIEMVEENATESLAWRLSFVDRAASLVTTGVVDLLFRSTIVQNAWLKLLGASVDWSADISCLRDFRASTAEFLEIGPNTFLAGSPRLSCSELRGDGSILRHSRIRIEDSAYVGYGSAILPGTTIQNGGAVADFALVGARKTVKSQTTILGLDGYSERLIAFKRLGASIQGEKTASWRCRSMSLVAYQGILLSLILAAIAFEYISVCGAIAAVSATSDQVSVPTMILFLLPIFRMSFGALAALIAVAHKRYVLGSLRPVDDDDTNTPTRWEPRSYGTACWLVQFRLNIAADAWLETFAFTPVINMIWRAMGAEVGYMARLSRIGPPDHDALSIGRRAFVDTTTAFYAHDFKGGGLTFKRSSLGDDVAIFGPSAILPGTTLSSGIALGAGSMTLAGMYSKPKGNKAFALYQGNPTRICLEPEFPPDDEYSLAAIDGRADIDWRHRDDNVRIASNRLIEQCFELISSASESHKPSIRFSGSLAGAESAALQSEPAVGAATETAPAIASSSRRRRRRGKRLSVENPSSSLNLQKRRQKKKDIPPTQDSVSRMSQDLVESVGDAAASVAGIVACGIVTFSATSRVDFAGIALVVAAIGSVVVKQVQIRQNTKPKRPSRKRSQKQLKNRGGIQQFDAVESESLRQTTSLGALSSAIPSRASFTSLAESDSTQPCFDERGFFGGVRIALVVESSEDNENEWRRDLDRWRSLSLCDDESVHSARLIYERMDGNLLSRAHRVAAVVGGSGADLLTRLDALDGEMKSIPGSIVTRQRETSAADSSANEKSVVLMFGGESLYDNAAKDLWMRCEDFRLGAERAGRALNAAGVFDDQRNLLERFLGGQGVLVDSLSIRHRNAIVFAIQYALASVVLDTWGLKPSAAIGYSIGELAAAVVSGILDLCDVAEMFAATSYTSFDIPGSMAVCSGITRERLEKAINADDKKSNLVVAAEYSSDTFMISGPPTLVQDSALQIRGEGGTCSTLSDVNNAYHSPLHSVVTGDIDVTPAHPRLPFYSCAYGGLVKVQEDGYFYEEQQQDASSLAWPRTLTDLGALYSAPVLFSSTIHSVCNKETPFLLLDLSLKGDLTYYYSAWLAKEKNNHRACSPPLPRAVATLRPDTDSCERCVLAAADLLLSGVSLSQGAFFG